MESKIYYNQLSPEGKRMEVVLTDAERAISEDLQREYKQKKSRGFFKNALGYEISITTLTTIMKKITEQKFFQIAPADYLPVRVGEGAWSSNLVTYRSYNLADDFSTGIVNTGTDNARLARGDAGVDSITIDVFNWAKGIGWSIIDLEQAAKSGNWDLVTAKEKARKMNWDLGVQKVAFLGLNGQNAAQTGKCLGLLNQPTSGAEAVTVDTTTLTNSITSLAGTPSLLSAFIAQVLNVYRANCSRSAWPTHLIIPESDYLGLATPSSAEFPLKSILQLMQETFQTMTGNKNFKILPCAYADASFTGGSNQIYTLLNYAEESIRMDIPVDYTNTLANSIDNFSFQNAAYGQLTGVKAYRPKELYYMVFPASNLA